MSLVELNNDFTDKNTTHSYLPLYDKLLKTLKNTAKNVLEVGIGDFETKNGGSLLLWSNYFTNATIYGIDILPINRVLDIVINDPTIKLYCPVCLFSTQDNILIPFANLSLVQPHMLGINVSGSLKPLISSRSIFTLIISPVDVPQ